MILVSMESSHCVDTACTVGYVHIMSGGGDMRSGSLCGGLDTREGSGRFLVELDHTIDSYRKPSSCACCLCCFSTEYHFRSWRKT